MAEPGTSLSECARVPELVPERGPQLVPERGPQLVPELSPQLSPELGSCPLSTVTSEEGLRLLRSAQPQVALERSASFYRTYERYVDAVVAEDVIWQAALRRVLLDDFSLERRAVVRTGAYWSEYMRQYCERRHGCQLDLDFSSPPPALHSAGATSHQSGCSLPTSSCADTRSTCPTSRPADFLQPLVVEIASPVEQAQPGPRLLTATDSGFSSPVDLVPPEGLPVVEPPHAVVRVDTLQTAEIKPHQQVSTPAPHLQPHQLDEEDSTRSRTCSTRRHLALTPDSVSLSQDHIPTATPLSKFLDCTTSHPLGGTTLQPLDCQVSLVLQPIDCGTTLSYARLTAQSSGGHCPPKITSDISTISNYLKPSSPGKCRVESHVCSRGVSQSCDDVGTGVSQPYDGVGTGVSQSCDDVGTGVSQPYDGNGTDVSQPYDGVGTGVSQPYDGVGTVVQNTSVVTQKLGVASCTEKAVNLVDGDSNISQCVDSASSADVADVESAMRRDLEECGDNTRRSDVVPDLEECGDNTRRSDVVPDMEECGELCSCSDDEEEVVFQTTASETLCHVFDMIITPERGHKSSPEVGHLLAGLGHCPPLANDLPPLPPRRDLERKSWDSFVDESSCRVVASLGGYGAGTETGSFNLEEELELSFSLEIPSTECTVNRTQFEEAVITGAESDAWLASQVRCEVNQSATSTSPKSATDLNQSFGSTTSGVYEYLCEATSVPCESLTEDVDMAESAVRGGRLTEQISLIEVRLDSSRPETVPLRSDTATVSLNPSLKSDTHLPSSAMDPTTFPKSDTVLPLNISPAKSRAPSDTTVTGAECGTCPLCHHIQALAKEGTYFV